MPVPDITFFINNNDSQAFDYIVNLDMVDVGTDCEEMRFSNNTVDWTPWEVFSTLRVWDFRLYGGSLTYGQRFVFAQFKNASGVTDKSDSILLYQINPTVEFKQAPLQRSDAIIVDIPYTGVEHTVVGAAIDLQSLEYDLTGLFSGDEKKLSVKEADPENTGVTALLFESSGTDQNIVWDVLEDVDPDAYWNTAKVRFKAHYGPFTSDYFVTDEFIVNTRENAVSSDDPLGKIAEPGKLLKLELMIYNSDGTPKDADVLPEIFSIVDGEGVERLVAPVDMVSGGVNSGYYYYDYMVPVTPEGQWVAKVNLLVNGEASIQDIFFYVSSDPIIVVPTSNDACQVFGTLYCENGAPAANIEVMIMNDDLTDPGHFNPTVIGIRPITVTTDDMGFFSVNVIRNSEVIVYIKDLNYRRRAKIPDQIAVDFREMILNLPTPPRDQFGNRT